MITKNYSPHFYLWGIILEFANSLTVSIHQRLRDENKSSQKTNKTNVENLMTDWD